MACMSDRYRVSVSRQQAASIHRVLFRWGKYLFIVQHSPGRERESDSQNNFSITKLSVWSLMYILHSRFLNRPFLECSPGPGAGCMVWPCMCVRCPSSQLTPNLRQRLVAAWWLMVPLALVHFLLIWAVVQNQSQAGYLLELETKVKWRFAKVSIVSFSRSSFMIIALASQFYVYLPWSQCPFSIVS